MVDAHVHLYSPEASREPGGWASARGERHWANLTLRRRRDGRPVQTHPTVDELLAAMDRDGIERVVLLGWYWQQAATCAEQNRFYAQCVRAHPDRLAAFATLHPAAGRDETLTELRRARDEGLIGLGELSPHSQEYAVTDPVFAEVLERAADLQLPVNLHVTDPESRPYPGRIPTPLMDFVALAKQHSRTTFILAHWGGLLPLRHPEATSLENLRFDTAASPLLYPPDIWARFTAAVGAGRVLFGSDYPLDLYPRSETGPDFARLAAEARASGLAEEDLEQILQGNAGLLGLTGRAR